jgi:hypothetical protein
MKTFLHLVVSLFLLLQLNATAQSKKLKVFILAGQSNMEGHAQIETFDYIGDDSATAPLLKQMLGVDGKSKDYSKYREWMADFIRDVRKDLDAPKMPFIIGVLGVDGLNANDGVIDFRKAMAALAQLPEFKGNVMAVETAPFWPDELDVIDKKRGQVKQMRHLLKVKNKNTPNKDGAMDKAFAAANLQMLGE